jgi:ubiquinone biosynthesis protein
MMGICPPKYREYLSSIIVGFVKKDAKIITKALMRFTRTDKINEIDQLEYQISELIEQYSYIHLKDLDMGDCLNKLIKLILEYKLKMPLLLRSY